MKMFIIFAVASAAAVVATLIQRHLARQRLGRAYNDLCGILARLPGTTATRVRPDHTIQEIFGVLAVVHCPEELGEEGAAIRQCAVRFHAKRIADERGLEYVAETPTLTNKTKRHYRILVGLRYPEH